MTQALEGRAKLPFELPEQHRVCIVCHARTPQKFSNPLTAQYIMGRRYCGSTVLSAMLNSASDVQSVGELIEGKIEGEGDRSERFCSCGARIQECSTLTEIRRTFEETTGRDWDRAAELIEDQSDPRHFLSTLTATSDSERVRVLRRINISMIKAIAQVGEVPFVLDSSKECARGLFLARFVPNVKIIHLVRNPEGLAASQLRRMDAGHGFSVLGHEFEASSSHFPFVGISSLNWTLEYILGEVVRQFAPSRVLRVRYEDLCAAPRCELERIGRFIRADMQAVVRAVENREEIPFGHSCGQSQTPGGFVCLPAESEPKNRARLVAPSDHTDVVLAYDDVVRISRL